MRFLFLAGFLLLGACGADGLPTAPPPPAGKVGVTVSGDVQMGVVKNGI